MVELDPVEISQRLIRCPSVTPADAGALDVVQAVLKELGFTCQRLTFEEPGTAPVDNLFARLGTGAPVFAYAGHTDVVPVGDAAAWQVDPFGAEIVDGRLFGRGAADMKGSIGAFLSALNHFVKVRGRDFDGSIALLITGDEEAAAVNGTRKLLAWMQQKGTTLDHCIVGEPTSNERLGDMIKIGRRGAMNGRITVFGTQGHSAYAHLADNPVHHLVAMLTDVLSEPLCQGSEHFPPTSLQIVSVDVGNPATNVIPAEVTAVFDCRFSDNHSSASVEQWLRERLDRRGARYDVKVRVSGESFLTPPGLLSDLVAFAVEQVTGAVPELGTTGGTSDARFIKDHAPVVELGLRNATAHKVDEHVEIRDIEQLTAIYRAILDGYFAR